MLYPTAACFSTFYQSILWSLFYENFVNFIFANNILTGEPILKYSASQFYQLSSESEASITLHCQLYSTRYTAVTNQELFEKYLCN